MDMGTMTMQSTAAATSVGAASTTTAPMDMDMAMGGCKISMLWNWNTVDSCFIAESWHITSPGMFAGSCIGVILLTMSLELLRRAVKEYDRYLIRQHTFSAISSGEVSASKDDTTSPQRLVDTKATATPGLRPSILQQAVRAFLHMVQFAVAYFIMLLAMYYNGYIIICIFIGAFIGAFVFQWEVIGTPGRSSTSAANEATVCCG